MGYTGGMKNLEEFLTPTEAATVKGIHRNNILKAIRAGNLPAIKKGKFYLIRRADLDAYELGKRRRKPPPEG